MKSKCCQSDLFQDQYNNTRCGYCLGIAKGRFSYRIIVILFGILMLTGGFSITAKAPFSSQYIHKQQDTIEDCCLQDSCLLEELIKDSCILPNVAISQAKIESSHYTSKLTFTNKNIFGIKFHKCQYVKNEKNGYANYKTYRDCIKCYCKIQHLYLQNIDGKYAENSDYVKLIKSM